MNKILNVSSAPHIRSKITTNNIMLDVIIALLPATCMGIYLFKLDAFLVIITTVLTTVLSEYIYEKLMHKTITIKDGSAIITGLLLALNLPSTIPLWICVLGGVFAIIVVKQLYGGLGQNFMNPALAARCFLLISFAGRMTSFTYDGITSPTPLAIIKNGGAYSLTKMFFGFTGGCIGETSVIAILIGAAYLLFKHVINLRIPLSYLVSFSVFIFLFSNNSFNVNYLLCELCGGGLMLGAFFMATDYVTSPITNTGKIIFGILLGLLTFLFRIYGNNAEGVSFAIIISNLMVPLIEKFTLPTPFGKKVMQHEK
ncbi:MAG: RnfABCDGE type electron transport complex subunit D [Thomasclavelia sp.]|jgi:electron transport complex protein RnfD|nr:RnfABCDGE type electron transport complex subunit D [Thomasclavelia sp.]